MKYVMEIPPKADFVTAYYMEDGLPVMYKSDRIDDLEPYIESDRKAIEDEVWELADYMYRMSQTESCLCFGFSYPSEVTMNLTYQEAKSKFEAWLKQKDEIRVGDEILPMDTNFDTMIVTRVYKDVYNTDVLDTIGFDGSIYSFLKAKVKKTGRHFDEVAELLKKMRGDSDGTET